MSKDQIKRIHRIYGWISAGLILCVGIALIASCLMIYSSGEHPFSADIIAAYFSRISLLVLLCAIAIAGGFILSVALPLKEPTKAMRNSKDILNNLRGKVSYLSQDEKSAVTKQIRLRQTSRGLALIFTAAVWAYPVIYMMDGSHFTTTNLNENIMCTGIVVLAASFVSFNIIYLHYRATERSIAKEIEVYKTALAAGNVFMPAEPEENANNNSKLVKVVRTVGFIVAVCLIIMGALNGGASDALSKAIRICTECIGLG